MSLFDHSILHALDYKNYIIYYLLCNFHNLLITDYQPTTIAVMVNNCNRNNI